MRFLARTAFWLGVTIYYLPSPAEHLAPRALPNGIGRPPAESPRAARRHASLGDDKRSRKCRQTLARDTAAGASRKIVQRSQDTLTPSDLAIPWRGPSALDASSLCDAVARK